MAEPAIRELGLGDRDAWAELRYRLWPNDTLKGLRDELAGMLEGDFAGFGAYRDGALVGFAEVSERPYGDGCDTAPVAWLEGIYVLPLHRQGGIGRRLVEACAKWGRDRGLSEIGSDVEIANMPSRLSHARWGFAETERLVMLRRAI